MESAASVPFANEDARSRVLRAAIDLFARRGFAGASVREIAEAAGVTKPTLYYYFGSKESLGLAILQLAEETIEGYVSRMTGEREDIVERMIGFVEAHFVACRENESLARFLYSLTFAPSETQPRFNVEQIHHGIRETLDGILREAAARGLVPGEALEEANLIMTGIINIYLMVFLDRGLELNRERAEGAVRCFLDGVKVLGAGER